MAAAILAAILFFPVEVDALSAQRAILMDSQTGRIIYDKNADERSLIRRIDRDELMGALVRNYLGI